MSVKINQRGSWPKLCCDCEVVLNPGVNCYLSMFKNGSYKCHTCKKKQSKIEHDIKWQLPWFRDVKAKYLEEYHKTEPAAVYAVYYKEDIVYIGESTKPQQRRTAHFSKHIKRQQLIDKGQWQQPMQKDLALGILDRKHLSFEILEYIQDTTERKAKEKHLLDQHKAAFGEYPKYNTRLTDKPENHKKRKA